MAEQELSDEQAQSLGLDDEPATQPETPPQTSGVGLNGAPPLRTSYQVKEQGGSVAPVDTLKDRVLSDDEAQKLGLNDPEPDQPNDPRAAAYIGAQDTATPKQAAEAAQHARETGIPPDLTRHVIPELNKARDEAVLGGLMQSAPETQSYLSADPSRAAHLKEEPGIFGALSWAVTGHFEKVHHSFLGMEKDELDYHAPFWAQAFADNWRRTTDVLIPQFMQAHGMAPSDAYGDLSERDIQNRKAGLEKDYGAQSWPSKAVVGVANALSYVSQAVGAGAAAATLLPEGAAAGGGIAASWLFNHITSFGPAYDRLKSEGASDEQARTGADVAAGVTATLIEATGGAAKFVPGIKQALTKTVAQETAAQLVKRAPLAVAAKGLGTMSADALKAASVMATAKVYEEVTSEAVKAINDKPIDLREGALRVAQTFGQSFQDMLGANLFMSGRGLMHDVARAHTLQTDAKRMEMLFSATEQSKTLANHPTEGQEFIKQAQADGPVFFHVPAEDFDAYWKEKGSDPAVVGQRLGSNYAEAKTLGGDVKIPVENYLSTFAKTEHLRGMEDIVRLNQDGLSLKQVRILDEALPREAGDGSDEIEKTFTDQALAAKTPPKVAGAVGKIVAAAFRGFAKEEGQGRKPLDIYKDFPLNIHGPAEAEGRGMDVAAQEQGVGPGGVADAQALISRMRPENQAKYQVWFDYATGNGERPKEVDPVVQKGLAKFGVWPESEPYPFEEGGRDMQRQLPGVRGGGGRMPEEIAKARAMKSMAPEDFMALPHNYFKQADVPPDSAPQSTPHDLALAKHEARIQSHPAEHAVAIGSDGETLLEHTDNHPTQVQLTPEQGALLLKRDDVTFTHNHPRHGSLSSEDLALAVAANFREIRAITPEGTVWSATRPESGWGWEPHSRKAQMEVLGVLEGAGRAADVFARSRMGKVIEAAGGDPNEGRDAKGYSDEVWGKIYAEELSRAFNAVAKARKLDWRVERKTADARGDLGRPGDSESLDSGVPPEEGGGTKLFQSEGGKFQLEAKGRGYITFSDGEGGKPRRFDIHILENADESTLAHETFHFLSEVMGDLAQKDTASAQLKADHKTLLDFAGHASREDMLASRRELRSLNRLESRTPEEEARLKELTAKEERLTGAWEQYLAEGKSPSAELARVFARFKNWMLKIYKGIEGIQRGFKAQHGEPLNLSDDVRKVFDRLLASQDAVTEASRESRATGQMDKLLESMTPEQRLEYARTTEDARSSAETELVKRISSGQREETTAFIRDERVRLSSDAEAELGNDPAMRTLRYLEKGDLPEDPGDVPAALRGENGEPLRLNRKLTRSSLGQDVVNALPRSAFAVGDAGIHPNDLAQRLGWDSGAHMAQGIIGEPRYSDALKAATEARLRDLYGHQLLDRPDDLVKEALDALQNEKAMRKALLELQHMRRLLDKGSDPRSAPLTKAMAEDIARRLVATKTVGELTAGEQGLAGYYRRTMESAAKRSFGALDKGNVSKAYAEKSAQLLNLALYREARDQREEMLTAERKLSALPEKAWKDADPSMRDAHDAILQAVGMREPGQVPLSIEPFLAKAQTNFDELAFDEDAIRELVQDPKEWKELTPDEAGNVRDAVLQLRHLARDQREVVIDGRRMERAEVFKQMAEAAAVRGKAPLQPRDAALEAKSSDIGSFLRNIDAQLATPDTLIRMLDGGKDDGPFRKALWDPLTAGRNTKRELTLDVTKKIVDLWHNLPKDVQDLKLEMLDLSKELPLPADLEERFGGPVSRPYLWMLALNLGNDGNKQRLLDGYGWTERQVMDVLDKHMTKPEWDFVQGTWDVLNTLYPHLATLHERETGVRLPKVEATPVVTKHGTYEGGYFPAKEDPRSGAKSGPVRQTPELVADIFGDSYSRASVASGSRKSRVQKADYVVNLSWSVVPSHIAQAVHDIAYREPVKQIASLILDKRFRDIAEPAIRSERARMFPEWLKAVATESADSSPASLQGLNRAMGWVRGRAMRTQLGGNLGSMAKHFLDPAMGVASGTTTARDTAVAWAKLSNPATGFEMRRFALENSKELQARDAHRLDVLQRQMKDIGRMPPGGIQKGLEYTAHGAQEFLGVFHDTMDKYVSTTTWSAKYAEAQRAAQAAGTSHEDAHAAAVKKADAAVQRIYPSQELTQMSGALRNKGLLGTSLMFMGFANKVWNLKRQAFDNMALTFGDKEASFTDKAGSVARFAGVMGALAVIGAGSKFLGGLGKKEDETTPEWIAATALSEPFSDTPFLATVAEAAAGAAAHKLATGETDLGKINFRNTPVVELINELYGKAARAAKDEDLTEDQKIERYIETLTTVAFAGSGATQIHRTLDYAGKLNRGDVDPRGPLDVAGGLIYGDRKGSPANPLTATQSILSGE